MRVLVLSHRDILAVLRPQACAEAMAAVLAGHARGETFMPLRSVMMPPGAPGFMGLMPGWSRGRGPESGQDGTGDITGAFALKAVCIMPGNPARGLDAHQGLVTLFDGETGVPTAILDASAVTAVRTAAVTAVATGALARPDAATLAVLGAGTQARAHLRALAGVRAFERVWVYAPTTAHAEDVAAEASAAGLAGASASASVTVAASAQEALRDADVVVTVTSAREPVLRREWLKPGAHLNAVGASSPTMREIDTATVAASALFCDSRESLRNEAGEFRLAVTEGLITGVEHVRAELGEVLAATTAGRRDASELTMFRSLGLAIEDLAAAQCAVATAMEQGIGTEVEL
ncbi:MAG TPA: ornithine cyclodeaminase family protein [Streptosporangiaceae bacterium]|nr:ornithine cyclodeaminase family protein [Streptosporangiaceae bacterium]